MTAENSIDHISHSRLVASIINAFHLNPDQPLDHKQIAEEVLKHHNIKDLQENQINNFKSRLWRTVPKLVKEKIITKTQVLTVYKTKKNVYQLKK